MKKKSWIWSLILFISVMILAAFAMIYEGISESENRSLFFMALMFAIMVVSGLISLFCADKIVNR